MTGILLGLECGGTRTTALATDFALQPIARLEAGPCNLRLVTDDQLAAHFHQLSASLPEPSAIGVGMAGVRDAVDCARIGRILETVWPGVPHRADHDLESALAAAELDERGTAPAARVMILSGTGSCCYGRARNGKTAKVGGWGHLLGDRGSAYDIAFRALRATASELDHTHRWGLFGAAALRVLALNEPNDLIAWLQTATKTEVAALAPQVFAAAAQGDRVARRTLQDTTELLARDGLACARWLTSPSAAVEFVLTGSVLLKQPQWVRDLRRRLLAARPKSQVKALQRESVWGAVAMARSVAPKTLSETSRTTATPSATSTSAPAPGVPPPRNIPATQELSPTERRHPGSHRLDRMSLTEALKLMLAEDAAIPAAILPHQRELVRLIQRVVQAFQRGGRLFYVGAGTSGRLGVLDASECPPTFSTPPDWVQGIIAGGVKALHSAVEGAEDDLEAGARAIEGRDVNSKDVVLGIAASGRTPFVWGALQSARNRGATTGLLCFNPHLVFAKGQRPDFVLAVHVGPEILTGSTRLKSGTATKLILNAITTLAMVKLGKVVGNLMVDLNPSNVKLRDRAVRLVVELTGVDAAAARAALVQVEWRVKPAVAHLRATPKTSKKRPRTRPKASRV